MGLNAQASAGSPFEVPVASVAVSSTSTSAIYTVPSGRYFRGWIGGSSGQYGIKVNGATIMENLGNNNLPQPQGINVTLYAGTTIKANGGSSKAWIVGVEYANP